LADKMLRQSEVAY
jgi:hypothetical protein